MTEEIQQPMAGGMGDEAPIGARFLASLFDLVLAPIILGIAFGFLFLAAPATLRNIVLVVVNIAWTCLRDIKGGAGPGKRMAGIKVVDAKTGEMPSLLQLGLRNILLWFPFVLLFGFIIEFVIVFIARKDRLGDRWAGCRVIRSR